MRILVYGINYTPELTGIGKYTSEMCAWLAAKGHQVTVITAMPYYPNWKVFPMYQGKWWFKEVIDGVTVCRVPLFVPSKVTGATRIIHEFSFALFSYFYLLPALFRNSDVMISVCPPFHLGFSALLFKWLKRIPVIYHIQDLQVDAARKLGLIKNETILGFLERGEKFILNNVDRISSISEGMKKNILNKHISHHKYISFPNWVDVDFIKPLSKEESLRNDLGFSPTDKIVLYSGNMGEKQGLEIIIEAAENLKHIPNLYFVFAGEGASRDKLKANAADRGLQNVKFFSLQPYSLLSRFLAIADIHLVIQKEAAADLLLPSKLMTILAVGGTALVTASSGTTLHSLIATNQIGLLATPENLRAITLKIETALVTDNRTIRENARKFAVEKLGINGILSDFQAELLKLCHD